MTFRPTPSSPCLIISGINAKTVATHSITTDPKMSFILFDPWFEATTLSGTGAFTFSIGTNSSSFNNLVASTSYNPATQKQYNMFAVISGALIVAPNTNIVLNITSGSTATTMTVRLLLTGAYF